MKINQKIINEIDESCKEDKSLKGFLKDLLLTEAGQTGSWRWKEVYKKSISKYSSDEEETM
jgi:hypothetical protein